MSEELVPYGPAEAGDIMASHHDPKAEIEYQRRCAVELKKVLDRNPRPVIFNGRRFLECSDWQLLGSFFGLGATIEYSRPIQVDGAAGWEARARVVHRASGMEIAAADAHCTRDEPKWGTRPKYEGSGRNRKKVGDEPVPSLQLRSMASTRATSRALAMALRHVAVLGGYAGTPAEDVDDQLDEQPENGGRPEPVAGPGEPAPTVGVSPVAAVGVAGMKKIGEGSNDRGAWKLYKIDTTDGKKYVTFSESIAMLAAEACKKGSLVVITVTEPPIKAGGDPQIIEMEAA